MTASFNFMDELEKFSQGPISQDMYRKALSLFDAAICEAYAVSQKQAVRLRSPNISYATYVFARMCGHGVAMIRSVPFSRWSKSDFHDWHFGSIAGHARAILEGYLLFYYLVDKPQDEAELEARISVMYLNDCTRRLELFSDLEEQEQIQSFTKQREELQEKLSANSYFQSLPPATQKSCLNGKYLMIATRDENLKRIGFNKRHFDAIYDLWSQHTHILPISFLRMEPNGRGSGLENDTDRSYIGSALLICAGIFSDVTSEIVDIFPDVASVRNGIKSQFSPGPHSNRPRHQYVNKNQDMDKELKQSALASAINGLFDRGKYK